MNPADTKPDGNPWDLTAYEASLLDALIDTGSFKQAAFRQNITVQTFVNATVRIKQKMGTSGSRIHHVLLWDRWRQANQVKEDQALIALLSAKTEP